MSTPNPNRELALDEIPAPPLFKLVDGGGVDVFEKTEVTNELAAVGALFSSPELAEEFSADAVRFGMGAFAGTERRVLEGWDDVEVYADSGEDYVLVVTAEGTGLFHAGDVARHAAQKVGEFPFPLYLFSDERGEAPLISVEDDGGEILVAALFTSPEKASAFRGRAAHLELPAQLGTIADAGGLRRHATVAREAGAGYAVVDPESGLTEAIPLEDLIR